MTMDDLNCGILTISFSTVIDRGCNNTNSYDATVCCYKCINISSILIIFATDTTRIWNSNPFPGLIQLQWGSYSNQGHVEVYCNGEWETICDNVFSSTDAQTICKQLWFNSYYNYDHLKNYY